MYYVVSTEYYWLNIDQIIKSSDPDFDVSSMEDY